LLAGLMTLTAVPSPARGDDAAAELMLINGLQCTSCHQDPHAVSDAREANLLGLQGTADTLWANKMTQLVQGAANPFVFTIVDPADQTLGATLGAVPEALRSQLGLPTDRGVLVTSVVGDGPAALAGLKTNDILMTLAAKPLAVSDDVAKRLKEAGEAQVPLEVIRAGKPLTLRVRPVYRVTIGPAAEEKTDLFIGVAVSPPDDALRTHLDLPAGKGLLITEVQAGSPAEKVGVKANDVLTEVSGKPLDSTEALVKAVQGSEGKSLSLKFLRAGKPEAIEVAPVRRKVPADPHREALRLWSLGAQAHPWVRHVPNASPYGTTGMNALGQTLSARVTTAAPAPDALNGRLDELDRQLKQLRQAVQELRDALKADAGKNRE
jgi:serine protease Do